MAKPKLALVPSAQGDKFYSVLPSSGVGDFDFTRSGGATRINSQGLIETVADGVSRLNYPLIDGKVVGCPSHLLEPQRTNLITYSEDFSNSYWTKSGVSVTSGFISPNGTDNAFKLVEDTSTNHQMYKAISGTSKTLSFFAKSDGRDWIAINCGSLTYFNVALGVVGTVASGSSATIESMPNGWFKCSVTETSAVYGADFSLSKDGTTTAYDGDGTSGVLLWGAQLEQGSYPTSYIKSNSGSATTRSAETASNSGDASTFNDSEGVLMAEISALDNDEIKEITLSNGGNAERILLSYNSIGRLDVNVIASDTYQAAFNYTNINSTEFNKILISYKQNDFKLFVNGFKVGNSLSGNIPSGLDTINFGATYNPSVNSFYGNTKQIQYYDSADIDLETLTSWVSFSDMAEGQLYSIQ